MSEARFNDEATAKAYQELLLPLIFEPWGRLLLEKTGLRPGSRVLDLATGPGTLARQAAAALGPSGHVTGVDLSAKMLAQARSKPPVQAGAPLYYVEASAGKLPFDDAFFDAVLCQQGLQFFPDQMAALKEMKRVLKPGGRLGLSSWAGIKAMTLFVSFLDAVDQTLPQAPKREALAWLDKPGLEALLGQAGFHDVEVAEETRWVELEGGLEQALGCVAGTTAGVPVRGMDAEQRARFEALVAEKLEPYKNGKAIHAPAKALVAVGRG